MILSELARIDAASGNEAAARDYIKSKIGGREDNLGSLIVGEGKTAVAAALDEKGFFVSEIGEKVRFCPMGRAEVSDLLNRKIRFPGGKIGFVCCDEKPSDAKLSDLYLKCGEMPAVGDVGCIFEDAIETESYIITKAPLRVASAAAAMRVRELTDVKLIFTAMYQIGKKGLNAALFREKPDYTIVIDTVFADGKNIKCGGGAVVKMMEGSYIADEKIRAFAEKRSCQRAVFKTPEVRAANSISFGANTAVVSVPVEKIGGYIGKIMKSDIENCADFVKEFIKTINGPSFA